MQTMNEDLSGRTLGAFTLEDLLGEGGMGQVYRARQAGLDRAVAVKVLHRDLAVDVDQMRRFRREIGILSRLDHPNVARIFDAGGDLGDVTWFAMELVDGRTLKAMVEDATGHLPVGRTLGIVRDAARGLETVHQLGIVHRDIKPANLMITNHDVVKVMDFGLAKDPRATRVTATGTIMGTPIYLPPECIVGDGHGVTGDVYQLGMVLYVLLTGRLPHEATGIQEFLTATLNKAPLPPSRFNRQVTPALEAFVLRCIATDPTRRPPSAESLADTLQAFIADPEKPPVRPGRTSNSITGKSPAPKGWSGPSRTVGLAVLTLALTTVGVFWHVPGKASLGEKLVHNLHVEAGLRRARVEVVTARPVAVRLEIEPARAVRISPGETSGNTFTAEVSGLAEGTEYELAAWPEGGAVARTRFRTGSFFVRDLKKVVQLNGMQLTWTTSKPARSSLVWEATGLPSQGEDVTEVATTSHTAHVPGLSPDREYDLQIVSHVGGGEVARFGPVRVRLLRSAVEELLQEFDRSALHRRVADLMFELGRHRTDRTRIQRTLAAQLEPLRPSLALIKPVAGEFFRSRGVFIEAKVKVYQTLKGIEHLDRLASYRKLPFAPLMAGMDWGAFYQSDRPFQQSTPPGGVEVLPGNLAPSDPARPGEGAHVEEWREAGEGHDMLMVTGMVKDVQEHVLNFPVRDPDTISRAELKLTHRPTRSKIGTFRERLHHVELTLNDQVSLVARIPVLDRRPDEPTVDYLGFDPSLLIDGNNRVRVRVKPCPPLVGEGARMVQSVELRTLRGR